MSGRARIHSTLEILTTDFFFSFKFFYFSFNLIKAYPAELKVVAEKNCRAIKDFAETAGGHDMVKPSSGFMSLTERIFPGFSKLI